MSRKDTYHDVLRRALVKDGWTITHDPLPITYKGTSVAADLGAEKATDLGGQQIAVEIIAVEVKDFDSGSLISEFEKALGQYRLYRSLLRKTDAARTVFLAVRKTIYDTFFQRPAIQELVSEEAILFIIFDENSEEVVRWIK